MARRVVIGALLCVAMAMTACNRPASAKRTAGGNEPAGTGETGLVQQLHHGYPDLDVAQTVESDLNKDGRPGLIVVYRGADQVASVAICTPAGQLAKVQDVQPAAFLGVQVLDHLSVGHVVIMQQPDEQHWLVSVWAFDGTSAKQLRQIESDRGAWIEGDRIIVQSRIYRTNPPGYDVATREVFWDAQKMAYQSKSR